MLCMENKGRGSGREGPGEVRRAALPSFPHSSLGLAGLMAGSSGVFREKL
jgi:hypothetical protein